jgi:hypothetical protein
VCRDEVDCRQPAWRVLLLVFLGAAAISWSNTRQRLSGASGRRCKLHDLQAGAPTRPAVRQQDPQHRSQRCRGVLVEHRQLLKKGENLSLRGGTAAKTRGERAKRATKTDFIVDATIIPRMMVTSAFSNWTEFSVRTGEMHPEKRGRRPALPQHWFLAIKCFFDQCSLSTRVSRRTVR